VKQLWFVLAWSCAGSVQPPPQPPPAPVFIPTTVRGLTLLDPGVAPLQRIVLEPPLHVAQLAQRTSRTATSLQREAPTLTLRARMEAVDRVGGVTHIVAHIEGVDGLESAVPKNQLDQVEHVLETIEFSYDTTPTNEISNVKFTPKIEGFDDLATGLGGGIIRLPDAPIGVHAKWRSISALRLLGQEWAVDATCEVHALTSDEISLHIEYEMHAHPGSITPKKRLTSGAFKMTEDRVMPLHGLVSTANSRGTGKIEFEITNDQGTKTVSTELETESSSKPLP
jgi:hypothetical protein